MSLMKLLYDLLLCVCVIVMACMCTFSQEEEETALTIKVDRRMLMAGGQKVNWATDR